MQPSTPSSLPGISDRARNSRERLRNWLVAEYGAVERGLQAFDTDADGAIGPQELSRAAKQAGIVPADVPVLLEHLGIAYGEYAINVLADRIEGASLLKSISAGIGVLNVPRSIPGTPTAAQNSAVLGFAPVPTWTGPAPIPTPAQSSAATGPAPVQTLAEAVKEVVKIQAEVKKQLFAYFDDPGGIDSTGSREAAVLQLMQSFTWQQLWPLSDDYGSTMLVLSSRRGMPKVCNYLLTSDGPTPEERILYANRANDIGWTALTLAAQNGFHTVCQVLLAANADPNAATTGTRLTPLMLAASNGHAATVRLLLDASHSRFWALRADPLLVTADGRTALDFVHLRIRASGRLVDDSQDPKIQLDAYGVRHPEVARVPDPFMEIQKELMTIMGTSDAAMGERHRDLLLGVPPSSPTSVAHQRARGLPPHYLRTLQQRPGAFIMDPPPSFGWR